MQGNVCALVHAHVLEAVETNAGESKNGRKEPEEKTDCGYTLNVHAGHHPSPIPH